MTLKSSQIYESKQLKNYLSIQYILNRIFYDCNIILIFHKMMKIGLKRSTEVKNCVKFWTKKFGKIN